MPVPGDGRYEWAGYRTMDELPRSFNPAAGWFGTSNEMNLPPEPRFAALKLGFEWSDPARAQRQQQIFGGGQKFAVRDLIGAQTDVTNVIAQRATALLTPLPPPSQPAVAAALLTLRSWDHRSTRESSAAAIFNVWYHRHLRPAVVAKVLPPAAARIAGQGSATTIIDLLEHPDARLGPNPVQARDELLLTTLQAAVDDLMKLLGPPQSLWQWGRLHQALFEHPLARVDGGAKTWNVGPISKQGDDETLGRSTWNLGDFRLKSGASARFVTDVGDWGNCWATNTPGQSGDPRSPHYRDLFTDWAGDKYFPLLFARAAIEKESEQRIVLVAQPR
jgi:penicillin amidase